ncbi:MAG TPA: hypothetical protein VK689_05790, partial [Armatimonadota bacterium]|nr:hypothetical protein [Armatimonadota bacterium]
PRSPVGYIALGELYADQARQADARPPLLRAFQLGERSAKIYALLTLSYADQPRDMRDVEAALVYGEKALQLGDRSSQLYFGLGLAYQRARRYPEAIRAFHTLLESRTAAHGAWVCLSQCYHALGETAKAQEAAQTGQRIITERQIVDRLRHQIQLAPHRLELRRQLAEHGMKTKNYFIAADQYSYLAKQVPNGAPYWRLAAKAMHRAGAKEQAAQAEQAAREAEKPGPITSSAGSS